MRTTVSSGAQYSGEVMPAVEDMYLYLDASNLQYSDYTVFNCLATGDQYLMVGGTGKFPQTPSTGSGGAVGWYYEFFTEGASFKRTGGDFTLASGTMTVIALTRISNNTSSWRTLLRGAGGDHHIIVESGGTRMGMYDNDGGGFQATSFNVPSSWATDWQILYWKLTNAPLYEFRTSPTSSTAYTTSTSSSGLTRGFEGVGGYQYSGTYGSQFWGDVAVLCAWNRELTDGERAMAEQVLERRKETIFS